MKRFLTLLLGVSIASMTIGSSIETDVGSGGGGGLTSINGDTTAAQTLATGTAGTDFALVDAGALHTFNLPAASAVNTGKLTSADWSIFNEKVSATRTINTTAPLTGGGDLSADRTIAIPAATGAVDGYLTAADWTTFNAKVSGSGATNRVTFWSSANAVTSDAEFLYDPTIDHLVVGTAGGSTNARLEYTPVIGAAGGATSPDRGALRVVALSTDTAASENYAVMSRLRTTATSAQTYSSGHLSELTAGYTGTGQTSGVSALNLAASTGNDLLNYFGNFGVLARSGGTSGLQVGTLGASEDGSPSVGVVGQSTSSGTTGIGVVGLSNNATNKVGGYFALRPVSAPVLPTSTAALIADNGANASDIAKFQDNGTDMWRVADAGHLYANDGVVDVGQITADQPTYAATNRPRSIAVEENINVGVSPYNFGNFPGGVFVGDHPDTAVQMGSDPAFGGYIGFNGSGGSPIWYHSGIDSKMQLSTSSSLSPDTDATTDFGLPTFRWRDANFSRRVGIGTTAANNTAASLQIDSTSRGFLPPRMTTTQRDAIASPPAGLMIYNTTTNKLNVFTTAWEAITSL